MSKAGLIFPSAPDEMSGSPVFQVVNHPDGIHSSEAFAGMLIRGSLAAGRAYFLEHSKIISLLESVVSGQVEHSGGQPM